MAKKIKVSFEFTDEEWAAMKKYFKSDADIRAALYEGAVGELAALMEGDEERRERVANEAICEYYERRK